MLYGRLKIDGRQEIPACKTETLGERMRGLLGRQDIPFGEALVLDRCDSIHTAFMQMPIDVVFASREGVVKKVLKTLKPWRMSLSAGASFVVEASPGFIGRYAIDNNSILEWVDNNEH